MISPLPTYMSSSPAADTVQQCMTDMQGRLDASQELEDGTEDLRSTHLDPTHLNLLYCYSVSCPLLTDDDESGMSTIIMMCIYSTYRMRWYRHGWSLSQHKHVCAKFTLTRAFRGKLNLRGYTLYMYSILHDRHAD